MFFQVDVDERNKQRQTKEISCALIPFKRGKKTCRLKFGQLTFRMLLCYRWAMYHHRQPIT
jgi:hypothetical protein